MAALACAAVAAVCFLLILLGIAALGPVSLSALGWLAMALWAAFLVWPGRR
jgi:hypothetical protein